MQDRGPTAYVSELIGTFALVMFITMVIVLFPAGSPALLGFLVIGLVHAFVLMMLIQTLGEYSGGHFNPAVTFGMMVLRKIKPPDAIVYVLLQLAGGVLGALFTKAILSNEGELANYGAAMLHKTGTPGIGGAFQGFLVEGLFTFFLVWAVVGMLANPKAPKQWAGWVIGGTLGVLVMIGGPLTGGSFNPARWFGPALVSGEWSTVVVYIFAPLVGGGLAAALYQALFLGGLGVGAAKPKPAAGAASGGGDTGRTITLD